MHTAIASPVRLEFVVRPPPEAGPGPCSGRPNACCSTRRGRPRVLRRRSTANGRPTIRGYVPRCNRPGSRQVSAQDHRNSRTAPDREILAASCRPAVPRRGVTGAQGYGLDFVDLQNSKVGRPLVRLEQRIMIRAEMSRCTLAMNGRVEHPTEVGTIDCNGLHADSDQPSGELVHDDEHPVALKDDGLASKEIHAPQAVSRVSD